MGNPWSIYGKSTKKWYLLLVILGDFSMFLARNSRIKLDEKRPIIQGWEC